MGWDSVDSYLATIKAKCSRQLIQFTLNNVTPAKGSRPRGLPTFLMKNYLARGQIQRADVADHQWEAGVRCLECVTLNLL